MKKGYEGGCHCGAVRFRASLDLDEAIICDCTICRKKGSIAVRIDESAFELLTPLDDLGMYQFNKRIARHYFCTICGIHAFHRPRSYPDLWAVNIRSLDGIDIATIEPRRVSGSKLD